MIRLGDHLRPEDIRTINRDLYREDPDYLRSDVWAAPAAENLRHINNVRAGDLQATIDAIDPFTEADVAAAWSLHMALHCGLHFWPDANHRTAIFSFNLALERAAGWHVGMTPEKGAECVETSKAARREVYGTLTLNALHDAGHPYRQVWSAFERDLEVREAGKGMLF